MEPMRVGQDDIRWRRADGEHHVVEILSGPDLFPLLRSAVARLEAHDAADGYPHQISWDIGEDWEFHVTITVMYFLDETGEIELPPDPDFTAFGAALPVGADPCMN